MDSSPFASPGHDSPRASSPEQSRGGCLTAFLVLMLIVNPITALAYLFAGEAVASAVPDMPGWGPPVLALACIGNTAGAVGVWMFKRWGVYLVVSMAVLAGALNLGFGLPIGQVVSGFLGPILLGALVRPNWERFD